MCHTCAAFHDLGGNIARKIGQIIRRGSSTWLVRIYVGRNPEIRKRRHIGKFIHGGLRSAQAHLNRMLAERDLGRNIILSRQTVGQYLDYWLNIWRPLPAPIGADESQPAIPRRVGLHRSPLPLHRLRSECCTVVLPVE